MLCGVDSITSLSRPRRGSDYLVLAVPGTPRAGLTFILKQLVGLVELEIVGKQRYEA